MAPDRPFRQPDDHVATLLMINWRQVVKLGHYLRLLRPKQWTKNLLVFAALVFTKGYTEPETLAISIKAFIALCLVSSAVYAMNDVLDAERDRVHPKKRNRPIASGAVTPIKGIIVSLAALTAGGALTASLGSQFMLGIVFYLALQVAYNAWLKAIPVVDVVIVSTGFVLRAALGAIAIGSFISGWLLFCTGSLALLLASAKRRHEFHLMGDEKVSSRSALAQYSSLSLDAMVVFSAGLACMSYGIYAIESETALQHRSLLFTVPFVVLGVLRYLFIAFAKNDGGEPETVLVTDPQIIIAVVLFLISAVYAMEGGDIPIISNPVR